jgi:molecular chaperone GrpE
VSKTNSTPDDNPERPEVGAATDTKRRDAPEGQGGEASGAQTDRGAEEQPATEEPAAGQSQNEYETLRADLEQMKDRAMRVQAELENYRKRVAREMADERRYAELSLMRDLLPVLDDMRRAIEAAEKSGESPQLLEGFRMVVAQLQGVLDRHHCTPIRALHEPFDPNCHEAILQQPSNEHPAGTVIYEARTGYRLHDRVVRPTQVIVAAPTGSDGAGAEESKL